MKKVLLILLFAIIAAAAVALVLDPAQSAYPVRGVDVSEYQGDVDFIALREQGVDFAYIKATEGSSYIDPYFENNAAAAQSSGMYSGAYHFFSFDSAASTQAENFISAISGKTFALPPVVDIELYGAHKNKAPDKHTVRYSLDELLLLVESSIGEKPVIYATYRSYWQYLRDGYDDYDIWIRSVYSYPLLPGCDWKIWQYSARGELYGYNGVEEHIDMNVFRGSRDDFLKWIGD